MTRLLFRGISTSKLTPDFDVVAMRGRAASLLISGQELHKVLMISCFFFFFFYGRPTLLSLIAARSVQQHFYERLPPINLPLIPHMKVMSLLMVTEVWSVSLIEIALHLGGNKHYSFMFPKAECGFWIRRARVIDSRIHQMWWFVECGLRLEPFHILLHFFVFYIERFCLTLQSWRFVIIHEF